MNKNEIFALDKYEQEIVELVSGQWFKNKVNTGWHGFGTVAEDKSLELSKVGFGAEFIFCKTFNLFPDFAVKNTSKRLGTDDYDAHIWGQNIDIKVNRNPDNPLMIPEYAKSDCDLFALFSCIYPRYRFEGFATNKMIFREENLRMTRVKAYVLDKEKLLDLDDLEL
jgi:hypothetical protein